MARNIGHCIDIMKLMSTLPVCDDTSRDNYPLSGSFAMNLTALTMSAVDRLHCIRHLQSAADPGVPPNCRYSRQSHLTEAFMPAHLAGYQGALASLLWRYALP